MNVQRSLVTVRHVSLNTDDLAHLGWCRKLDCHLLVFVFHSPDETRS